MVYCLKKERMSGMDEVRFRRMTIGDIPAVCGIRMRQLIEEQRENRRPPDEERDLRAALEDYYERHLSDGTFVSYLAETGGEIIGTSGMSFVEKPPWFGCPSGKIGLLSGMYTDPRFRRQGIARTLLSKVVGAAKEAGCGAVHITASDMGTKLYDAFGFEENGNFRQLKLSGSERL